MPRGRYVFIVDRLKELIKVKGLQVAPAEIEGRLLELPEISDAAVIGIDDERSGQVPCSLPRRASAGLTRS